MRKPRKPTLAQRSALADRLGAGLEYEVPLAGLTSFGIGGPAALYYDATTPTALADAVRAARALDIDYFLLGRGANILIGDRGYAGLVIANHADTVDIQGYHAIAASGALIYPDLIDTVVEHGLSGLEHYVGIPSTVGGALWQNLHFLSPAPARERTVFIAEVLVSAEVLTGDNRWATVGVDYFEFGYDRSVLHKGKDIVLSATFSLEPAPVETLHRIMGENLAWRAERHPPIETEPSAGSVFQKIEGIGAGRLIDACGLKGQACGDAEISARHANIIINRGRASAADVCALIMHAQQRVYADTGYWLTPELSFVGEFAPVQRLSSARRAADAG